MKKCLFRYRLALFVLLFTSSGLLAEQVWRGASVSNVIDEDVVIKDDILLPVGATIIKAVHKDITVELSRDLKISGHWAGPSRLYLIAKAGRKITFKVDHNLTFVGSSSVVSNFGADLLIVQSCPGIVEFAIGENKTVAITGNDTSFGVQMYVLMYGGQNAPIDEYCDEYGNFCQKPLECDEYQTYNSQTGQCCDESSCPPAEEYCSQCSGINEKCESRPVLSFVGLEGSSRAINNNRTILIGQNSILSFLSSRQTDIAGDSGYISFDPASAFPGRMILEIEDTGAFIVAGHLTTQRNARLIQLKNIDLAVAAGHEAIVTIANSIGSTAPSGLLVLNKNKTLFDLLVDPFLNLDTRNQTTGYAGVFCGRRLGSVIGANGVLWVQSDSYLDYVGLALNQIPSIDMFEGCDNLSRLIKSRNPSALFIDGNNNPYATPAQILFNPRSAVFFRSGIADDGTIRFMDDVDPFTIESGSRTNGIGNIVFDVEGQLDIEGPAAGGQISSKIELLSLEVLQTGGSLFVGSSETNFPLRTFNTEDGELLMYNAGAFLINNQMNLYNTSLVHSDSSHNICQNNDIRSEPAYIGGETFRLLDSVSRPAINFYNSNFNVEADVALTGLDLAVPNLVNDEGVALQNLSRFIFYSNGACIDNGTGRQMILGTRIGSTAVDGCSRVDGDSHLNIMEQFNAISSALDPFDPEGNQTLLLNTAMNDATINGVVSDLVTTSIHTIFFGGASNISIGTNSPVIAFDIITNPWLRIQGGVFSFETKNGTRSYVTGKNGIFVDLNGEISIDPEYIANFGVMITKSNNGIVDLPANQIFFAHDYGVANWNVDLSNPVDQVVVPAGQELASYIFNWILAKKDCINYTPYQITDVNECNCPPVTEANVTSLPTVQGVIDEFVIQATRIGDPIQFIIDGGVVRQLEFSDNNCSAEAPVAVIVLKNGGSVGLDDATTLGVNGITIIADGSGRVNINDDMIINNVCAFVKGPDFAGCNVLQLYSPVQHSITLKSGGTLDLSSFDNANDIVEIAGKLTLVVEPGAKIITGFGTLRFADDSQLLFEAAEGVADFFAAIPHGAHDSSLDPLAVVDAALPHNSLASLINYGAGLDNTDKFRVSIIGQGAIQLSGNAQGFIPSNGFVGIETFDNGMCGIPLTNFELKLTDNASFVIGRSDFTRGGVLQVGNVTDLVGHSVSFTLTLDGDDARFYVGSGGFVGLGVGIERFDGPFQAPTVRAANCPITFVSNENIVNTLNNVNQITFNFLNGLFEHDVIASGDDAKASLLAISADPEIGFNLMFNPALLPDDNTDPVNERESNFNMAGGGNMVLIQPGTGGLHPVVLDEDGEITPRLSVSVMASTLLQEANLDGSGISGAELFDLFKTHDAVLEPARLNTYGRANAAPAGDNFRPEFTNIMIDTVANGVIVRGPVYDIIGEGQDNSKRVSAVETAAVLVNIDPVLNEIVTATNIEN